MATNRTDPIKTGVFLQKATRRCPALQAVLDRLDQEPNDIARQTIRTILRDALLTAGRWPVLTAFQGEQLCQHDQDHDAFLDTELTWLARERNALYHRWQACVFRYLAGRPVEERDCARYYLALISRLYRLEYVTRQAAQVA